MRVVSAIFRVMIGLIFGLVAAFVFVPAIAVFMDKPNGNTSFAILAIVMLSAVFTFFAPTIRRAFGRGFLLAGLSFLALPLSVMLLSGKAANQVMTNAETGTEVPAAIGAGLAGIAVTGFATFVGLVLGAIFIIIGLVLALGGRREVIVVRS